MQLKIRLLSGVVALGMLGGARSLLADDSRQSRGPGVGHGDFRDRGHDYDRHDRHDRDHRHYTVRYHLDNDQRRHVHGREAQRLIDDLKRAGADAHVDGHYVHYHMHGNARRTFERHGEAHRFEGWLRSLGFHVKVVER